MFDALRQELLVQRAQVAERLSALEQAEAAFVRLQQVLGIEDAAESVQEPPTEAMAEAGPTPTSRPRRARPGHHSGAASGTCGVSAVRGAWLHDRVRGARQRPAGQEVLFARLPGGGVDEAQGGARGRGG
jgi:hypothetical protein